jgi:hypothetical protein
MTDKQPIKPIVEDLNSAANASVNVNAAVSVVQRQLETYNNRDLEAFLACFSEDIVCANVGGEVIVLGKEALRAKYGTLFRDNPNNHCELLHRICIGDKVIDYEKVSRNFGGEGLVFEVAAVYSVVNDLIVRCDFVK